MRLCDFFLKIFANSCFFYFFRPTRSPKYLRLSALTHNFTSANSSNKTANSLRGQECLRSHSWRTETVLHFFVDNWLRYDVEANRQLPSNEFIRVLRILVKQLHAFGNSANIDSTSMSSLRKMAQPMMKAHMYIFLRCIVARWQYDSSFSTVLELWLSYIQPWRYT